jgi:hypothetical protein
MKATAIATLGLLLLSRCGFAQSPQEIETELKRVEEQLRDARLALARDPAFAVARTNAQAADARLQQATADIAEIKTIDARISDLTAQLADLRVQRREAESRHAPVLAPLAAARESARQQFEAAATNPAVARLMQRRRELLSQLAATNQAAATLILPVVGTNTPPAQGTGR